MPIHFPTRIVCLTEEPTEVLYALGEQHRIVGISGYAVRPAQARQEKPRVSAFTSAKIDKILALQPDLAIGFSDMQADIAKALVQAGGSAITARWPASWAMCGGWGQWWARRPRRRHMRPRWTRA